MLNLVIAVIMSALVSIVIRLGENKCNSNIGMFVVNYIVCILLGLFYTGVNLPLPGMPGAGFAWGLGAVEGLLFLVNFVLLQLNIRKNGVVLAAVFMKLGLVVALVLAVILFGEQMTANQLIGSVLAVAAIVVMNYEKTDTESKGKGTGWLLLLLWVVSGVTDSTMNIFDKKGNPDFGDTFLLVIFLFAFLFAVILMLVKKEHPGKWDILFGMILGIPNYYAARFLLASLSALPAVVVYPVYSVATILVVFLVGVYLFHEQLSKRKLLGILLVVAALVFLNI